MTILITQILLFVGTMFALLTAASAYQRADKIAKATEKTFGKLDEIIQTLIDNQVIIAEAIDDLVAELDNGSNDDANATD